MINKNIVDYHPSPSQLISMIHTLIYLWTRKGFISPESFLKLFLNLHTPTWLRKSFKFIVLRLLANTFVSQKIKSVHFYSCPQEKLTPSFYHYLLGRWELPILSAQRFLKKFFPKEKVGERIMELKKIPKLTKVSITSFDKLHHL